MIGGRSSGLPPIFFERLARRGRARESAARESRLRAADFLLYNVSLPSNQSSVTAMFDTILPAPPDSILGLTEAWKADPNPLKVNLGVGVYKDATATRRSLHR